MSLAEIALGLTPRRKIFISYHHADELEVRAFIHAFDHGHDCFIARGIGAEMPGDVINSINSDYIMGRIRALYLGDSTITIVMLGNCTWSRRYCDWEIQSSLRRGPLTIPNGLLAIRLNSFNGHRLPDRLFQNLLIPGKSESYARIYSMPDNDATLRLWIEDAYTARKTRAHLIENPQQAMSYNRDCGHSWH